MTSQKKSIQKTVLIIIAIMVTILVLFINKITTPRYLSNIELKINGLELVKKAQSPTPSSEKEGVSNKQWILLVDNSKDKLFLEDVYQSLKRSIRQQVIIVYGSNEALTARLNTRKKVIPLIKPSGEFIAYFTSPYDKEKMVVTLSSVVTHR